MGLMDFMSGDTARGWTDKISEAAPLLMAMGQNLQTAPQQRDPRLMMAAMQQMQAQQKAKAEEARTQGLSDLILGKPIENAGAGYGFNPAATQPMRQGGLVAQMGLSEPQSQLLRAMAAADPEAAVQMAGEWMGPQGDPKRYNVGGALVDAQGNVIYENEGNERNKIGLNPIWGTDAQGNPVILQTSDSGEVIQAQMPDGVSISRDPVRIDAGTGTVLLDPITRQQIGFIPKDFRTPAAEAAAGKVEGTAEAERRTGSAAALRQADEMLGIIDGVANDPNLGNALGAGGYAFVPDIPGVNTGPRARIAQLQGRTFLQAFESLKGAGQITEVEGQKAEQAIARLRTTQTEEEFRSALEDLRDVVTTARQRAAMIGGGADAFNAERALQGMSDAELQGILQGLAP